MNKGFTLIEVIITLSLSLTILSIVISNVSKTTISSKRIISNQQVLESIFFTVDTLKSDLSKCGMRLQEAADLFNIKMFENTDLSFKVVYGITSVHITQDSFSGDRSVMITKNDFMKVKKSILIYNPYTIAFEYNRIKEIAGSELILANNLQHDYPQISYVIVLKTIEYKLYAKQNTLKRKTDNGYFQPLLHNVTDFYVTFFDESASVLYRIEVNKKEQVRGYIFLANLVKK